MTAIAEYTLTIRPYRIEDGQFVAAWRFARGEESAIILPPLGCVVEDDQGPCAVLWIAEPAGFGCAYFEYPISRPRLGLRQAQAAFAAAIHALMEAAGKCHDPPGEYHSFRAVTPAPLARVLEGMGWERETKEILTPMIYRRQ